MVKNKEQWFEEVQKVLVQASDELETSDIISVYDSLSEWLVDEVNKIKQEEYCLDCGLLKEECVCGENGNGDDET